LKAIEESRVPVYAARWDRKMPLWRLLGLRSDRGFLHLRV